MLEITRIARDKVVGLTPGSGDRLHGILKIAPAECQGLLQNLMIDRLDLEKCGEVDQGCSGLLLPQMLDQQVMQGGEGMRGDMPGCTALLDVCQQAGRIVEPGFALGQHVEHDVGVDEELHKPYLSCRWDLYSSMAACGGNTPARRFTLGGKGGRALSGRLSRYCVNRRDRLVPCAAT